jgi:hypothetical protein
LQAFVILLIGIATLLGQWIGVVHEIGISLELCMRFNRLSLSECFNPRIAVCAEQNADGNVQFLVEIVGKGQ